MYIPSPATEVQKQTVLETHNNCGTKMFHTIYKKISTLTLCFHYLMGPIANATADPGVVSSILARSHTLVEIDQEINSMVFLLILLIQEGLTLFKLK